MSAAEENTRGKRTAAKRGISIKNTNKTDFSGAKIGAFNSGNSSAAAGKGAKATTKAGGKKVVRMGGMSMGKPAPTEGKPPAGKPGTGGVSTTPTPPAMGKPAPTMTEGKPPSGRPGKPGRPMGKPGRPMGRPGKPRLAVLAWASPVEDLWAAVEGQWADPVEDRWVNRKKHRPARMGPKMMGSRRPGSKSDLKRSPREQIQRLRDKRRKARAMGNSKKAMKIRRRIRELRKTRKAGGETSKTS